MRPAIHISHPDKRYRMHGSYRYMIFSYPEGQDIIVDGIMTIEQVIRAGPSINDFMPRYVAGLAIKGLNKVGRKIRGSHVLIMGLTCKEDVADTRESPAENMVEELKEFDVNVFDVNLYWYDTTF